MIRLIATDLDGTLLAGGSVLPQENIDALNRAMAAGVLVTLASGRMPEATIPLAERIGVNAPLSLFNGAMTYDMKSGRVLRGRPLELSTAIEVLREVEKLGIYALAFPSKGYVMPYETKWTDYYANKTRVRGTSIAGKLSEWLNEDVYKLLCIDEPEVLCRAQTVLKARFPQLNLVKSEPYHLEIIAGGVDKAAGIRDLAACTGIDPRDMLAFGDEMNDLPMLEAVGVGYAMENAVEGVRARIRRIAPKNTDCGVARIVNLLLDEGRMGGAI